jgi:hypothetical protein
MEDKDNSSFIEKLHSLITALMYVFRKISGAFKNTFF